MGRIKQSIDWMGKKVRTLFLSLVLALSNVEIQVFKAVGGKSQMGGGIITKMLFRSRLLENFFAGKHDEKYVQQFYEILKKADAFLKNSTPHKLGASADTYAKTLGKKDKYGRRYDHFGFFDDKHKHSGKTLGEVIELETEERRTKDDDYKLIRIVNNYPKDVGFSKVGDVIKKVKDKDGKYKHIMIDTEVKSKKHEFPINVVRKKEKCVNKIEHLSEFLHIKEIAFEYRRFEFFIPKKYKTTEYQTNDKVVQDILNINEFYVKDDYGELTGYVIQKFVKRFIHNDAYDVFRFDGIEMEKI